MGAATRKFKITEKPRNQFGLKPKRPTKPVWKPVWPLRGNRKTEKTSLAQAGNLKNRKNKFRKPTSAAKRFKKAMEEKEEEEKKKPQEDRRNA